MALCACMCLQEEGGSKPAGKKGKGKAALNPEEAREVPPVITPAR